MLGSSYVEDAVTRYYVLRPPFLRKVLPPLLFLDAYGSHPISCRMDIFHVWKPPGYLQNQYTGYSDPVADRIIKLSISHKDKITIGIFDSQH